MKVFKPISYLRRTQFDMLNIYLIVLKAKNVFIVICKYLESDYFLLNFTKKIYFAIAI
jgi:hypothetical protein